MVRSIEHPLAPLIAGCAVAGVAFIAILGTLAFGWIGTNAAALSMLAWLFVALGLTAIVSVRLTARLAEEESRNRAEREALEEQLQDAHETLKRQQQALVQGEKMAAMGKMAAGVAHEIANPLASMDSVLQLAQRRAATARGSDDGFLDRPEMVEALREQVGRIDRIVRELTTFAHPNGEQRRTVPLCDLVKQSLDMLRFDHRLREVDVRCECAADVGEVRVIPQQIHQVLVNLILNALDALAQVEEPQLVIRTGSQNGWSTIEVADNGSGIEPEHRGRVFEPFFTTKPPGCGTGLGLSICATIVQQHGGRLCVDSTPGRGATFTVTLPAAGSAPAARPPAGGKRAET